MKALKSMSLSGHTSWESICFDSDEFVGCNGTSLRKVGSKGVHLLYLPKPITTTPMSSRFSAKLAGRDSIRMLIRLNPMSVCLG